MGAKYVRKDRLGNILGFEATTNEWADKGYFEHKSKMFYAPLRGAVHSFAHVADGHRREVVSWVVRGVEVMGIEVHAHDLVIALSQEWDLEAMGIAGALEQSVLT